MFLATLQLANTGNVEILPPPAATVVDSFGLHLLTTESAYRLDEYKAPSVAQPTHS